MTNYEEQRRYQKLTDDLSDGPSGPPRWLFWLVVGGFLLFILGIVAAILIFQQVLQPAQRQRVIDIFPAAQILLPPTPAGGIVATVSADNSGDAESLLDFDLSAPDSGNNGNNAAGELPPPITIEPTQVPTAETTAEPTEAAAVEVEPTEVAVLSTPTLVPPTEVPNVEPTFTLAPLPTAPPQSQQTVSNTNPSARLFGLRHEQQKWNNCGPTNVTMSLSYFGWQEDQTYAASFLKPNREDKNVSPSEMVDFVNEQTQIRAVARMGGNVDLLKLLVANDFPVIIETGLMPEAYDWIGHYRTIVGYDDNSQLFFIYDSFLGTGDSELGITDSYQSVDDNWRAFNRTFIVLFHPEDEGRVMSLLGELASEEDSANIAFEQAQSEAEANRQDAFAWFNMGTSLDAMGDYVKAARAFDEAIRLGLPWRILWYQFAPFNTYLQVERYDDVLSLVQSNLANAPELEEMYYWRGQVYLAQGETQQAASQFRQALQLNRFFDQAQRALDTI